MHDLWEYLLDPETPLGVMDGIYALFLLYGLIRGFFRGLAFELASLIGMVILFFGSWLGYRPVAAWLLTHTQLESQEAGQTIAYILSVGVLLIGWKLATFLVQKFLHFTLPKSIQRPGGAIFGILKSALVLCVLLLAVQISGHTQAIAWTIEDSAFGRLTQRWVPATLHRWAPEAFPLRELLPPPGAESSESAAPAPAED